VTARPSRAPNWSTAAGGILARGFEADGCCAHRVREKAVATASIWQVRDGENSSSRRLLGWNAAEAKHSDP